MISNNIKNETVQLNVTLGQFHVICIGMESLYAAKLNGFSGNEIADIESVLEILMPGAQECKTVEVEAVRFEGD